MSTSKNNIYAFVNVRQPKAIDLTNTSGLHILYDTSSSSTFYSDLQSASQQSNPLPALETEATTFLAGSDGYLNPDAVFSDFPWYTSMREYINANIGSLTSGALTTEFETQIGTTLADYLGQTGYANLKNKVWDNLFALLILNENPELIELLQQVLRQLNLIEVLDDGQSQLLSTSSGLASLNISQVVLPSPLFPLPKTSVSESPQDATDQPVDQSAIIQEIEDFTKAAEEIQNTLKLELNKAYLTKKLTQSEFCKLIVRDSDTVPSNTAVTAAECTALHTQYLNRRKALHLDHTVVRSMSSTTNTILTTTLKIPDTEVYVPFVIECINDHIQKQYDKLNISSNNQQVVLIGGALISIVNTSQFELIDYTGATNIDLTSRPFATPLGIGDLLVVTEELKRYEIGEIAHLENVMSGETKKRTHRNLSKTETETFEETSFEVQTENDVQSTERFEVSNEISEMVSEAQQTSAGLQVSGSYGAVTANASASYASQNSSLQSSLAASRQARELTERASRRVTEKTTRGRRSLTLSEIEVINEHNLSNQSVDAHFVGMYHWVNKVLKAQTVNKGKRLMYEFFVPEPAAFFIFSQLKATSTTPSLTKPVEPFMDLDSGQVQSFKLINRFNYGTLAAKYDVLDIQTPPKEFITVSKAFNKDLTAGEQYITLSDDSIEIPDGYQALNIKVSAALSESPPSSPNDDPNDPDYTYPRYITLNIAGEQHQITQNGTQSDLEIPIGGHTGTVPISMRSRGTQFAVNIVVECELTEKAYDTWRLETYNQIMESYQIKLSQYKSELEDLKSGIQIEGRNPLLNRDIEKTELKKACIKLFSGQRFEGFNAMSIVQEIEGPNGPVSFPDFDFIESMVEGQIAMFFEEAFEWENITYTLYPYYYARKAKWLNLMGIEDNDMKFEKFLKAGAARVLVPVKPEYTKRVLYYTETGKIWVGDDIPALTRMEHVSAVDEVMEANATIFEENIGDPWDLVVPTNLVYLNPDVTPDLPNYE